MELDLKKFKVKRPKPKFQLTLEIIKLRQELRPLQKKIFFEFIKHCEPIADPKKIMKKLYDKNSDLFNRVHDLEEALDKEEFKAAYGETLKNIESEAFKGDQNSWLRLLKWNITYLEHRKLREMIYEESTKDSSPFLKEIGNIICKPRRFHAGLKRDNFTQFILRYDPKKSVEKNLNLLPEYLELIEEDEGVIPDRRQIMRVFKKKKKK